MNSPTPTREELRLAALREYAIMDTPPEQVFDDLNRMTSFICGTPMATMTLLDTERQWFKAQVGMEQQESPIEDSICGVAIEQPGLLLVKDTLLDAQFREFPCVRGAPHIRFYAGAPLITAQGVPIGTMCAMDREPRELSLEQQEALLALARQTMLTLEMRRMVAALDVALREKRAAEEETRKLREMLPMCAWCRKIRDDAQLWHGIEEYFALHTNTRFSHGICPECVSDMQQELDLR